MSDVVSGLHRFMMRVGSILLKNGNFDIHSVDYEASSQTPVLKDGAESIAARMGITIANPYAEPHFGGLDFYSVACDHSKYTVGDLFTPSGMSFGTPRISVLDALVNSEHVGLRTNRRGAICSSGGTTSQRVKLFDNIYFDFYAAPVAGPQNHMDMPDSKKRMRRRAAMLHRAGVLQGMYLMDAEQNDKQYKITDVHGTGNLLVLYIEE